jgi:hypothetical protein
VERLSPSQAEILKLRKFLATNAAFIHPLTVPPHRLSYQTHTHAQLSRAPEVPLHNESQRLPPIHKQAMLRRSKSNPHPRLMNFPL